VTKEVWELEDGMLGRFVLRWRDKRVCWRERERERERQGKREEVFTVDNGCIGHATGYHHSVFSGRLPWLL
jgi:hypothetical protein